MNWVLQSAPDGVGYFFTDAHPSLYETAWLLHLLSVVLEAQTSKSSLWETRATRTLSLGWILSKEFVRRV